MKIVLAGHTALGGNDKGIRVKVGDTISIPDIGDCEVQANDSIAEGAETADTNNGVVLLPERVVFDESNMNDYNF